MNRFSFFKELKTSLLDTALSFYEPLVEEDIEKLHKSADKLLGTQWMFLTFEKMNGFEQKFIAGKPILCFGDELKIRAFSGVCPSCTNLLVLSTTYTACKCMYCETEYFMDEADGEDHFRLVEFPVKKQSDGYYVGMKKV